MTTVVSVTQNAVERDSRAFRVGASIARFGYESIVVEAEPSELDRSQLPFALVTLPPRVETSGSTIGQNTPGEESISEPAASLITRVGSFFPEWLRQRLRPLVAFVLRMIEPPYTLWAVLRRNRWDLRSIPRGDIYYLHWFWNFPAAYVKAKRFRARIIYDAHDANWEPEPGLHESVNNLATLRWLELLDRRCARNATAFITVGRGIAGVLERRFKRRPIVIRNCHDLRLDEDSPTDVRTVAGVDSDGFLLIVAGTPKEFDTVEHALSALTQLPGRVHLALIGHDHERRRDLITQHGLNDRVHLVKPVSPTQVTSFIRTGDASPILLQAVAAQSRYALPNRFFHAIAAGLPILYPSLPEIESICEEHDLGIEIDPTDADSIASGVRTLADDPKLAERYAGNVERARKKLNWEHEESILGRVLDDTLANTKRRL